MCALIVLCSNRSLGVHFSKVRSLTLDSWEPELIKVTQQRQKPSLNQSEDYECTVHYEIRFYFFTLL